MKHHLPALAGAALAAVSLLQPISSCLAQGSLTPPGPPAPTMKTLDQLEPRTDLFKAPAAAVTTSNAAYHYIITQPGSYYLSGNLTATKTNAIQINAEGVTLDLMGFTITRASVSGKALEITAAGDRAVVRNGSIRGFSYGVDDLGSRGLRLAELSVTGVNISGIVAGEGAVVDKCRVTEGGGIFVGFGSAVADCTVTNSLVGNAFDILGGSRVTNCVASFNTAITGFNAGSGCVLTGCVSHSNTSSSFQSWGFACSSNCTVTDCQSTDNKSTYTPLSGATGAGFSVTTGSTIQGCTASGNAGDGIRVLDRCYVLNNQCNRNGFNSGDGAGIWVHSLGSSCRIDSNNVTLNDRGIDVDGSSCLVVRNSAVANTMNYTIAVGNTNAQVLSPGPNFVSTDPWANFAY